MKNVGFSLQSRISSAIQHNQLLQFPSLGSLKYILYDGDDIIDVFGV